MAGKDSLRQVFKGAMAIRDKISFSDYKMLLIDALFVRRYASKEEWKSIFTSDASESVFKRLLDRYTKCLLPPFAQKANSVTVSDETIVKLLSSIEGIELNDRDSFASVYEYCLRMFSEQEGAKGGQFYTPDEVSEMLPYLLNIPEGAEIYDPAVGSGSLLVNIHSVLRDDKAKYYGQDINPEACKMAAINALIGEFKLDLGRSPADTLQDDVHEGKRYDIVVSNPPFNLHSWTRNDEDPRWVYGLPPVGNANYAWIEHILAKMKPDGRAAVILTNNSLTSNQAEEKQIRKALIENGLVKSIILLRKELFVNTDIATCIWLLGKNDSGCICMVDARSESNMLSVIRGSRGVERRGFSRAVPLQEIRNKDYSLFPARYIDYTDENFSAELIPLRELIKVKYGNDRTDDVCDDGMYPRYGSGGVIGRTNNKNSDGPSVIIGRKGSIGAVHYVSTPFSANSATYFVTEYDDSRVTLKYLYYVLSGIDFTRYDDGSGKPNLQIETLYDITIPLLTIEEQNSFVRRMDDISQKIRHAETIALSLKRQLNSACKTPRP